MVIIYGTRSSHLNSQLLEDAVCPSCQTHGELVMSVHGNYVHVLWIPIIPLLKKSFLVCNHCEAEIDTAELSPSFRYQFAEFKRAQKTPIGILRD